MNLGARYAFGAFRWRGGRLPAGTRCFDRTVDSRGPPGERAHVSAAGPQRAGHRHALSPHRRAVVGVRWAQRRAFRGRVPRGRPAALRRVAILHSSKLLTLCGLYFSLRHVDVLGGHDGRARGFHVLKTRRLPPSGWAYSPSPQPCNYAHRRLGQCRDCDGPQGWSWTGRAEAVAAVVAAAVARYEEMLRQRAVLVSNELVRASRRWLKELPPALRSGCRRSRATCSGPCARCSTRPRVARGSPRRSFFDAVPVPVSRAGTVGATGLKSARRA